MKPESTAIKIIESLEKEYFKGQLNILEFVEALVACKVSNVKENDSIRKEVNEVKDFVLKKYQGVGKK